MANPPRMTLNILRILRVLLEAPTSEHYGLEVGQAAGLRGGSLYPVLDKLEKAGYLTSSWEDSEPAELGRPRRRLYKLSPNGVVYARQALAEARQGLASSDPHDAAWGHVPGFSAPGGASA